MGKVLIYITGDSWLVNMALYGGMMFTYKTDVANKDGTQEKGTEECKKTVEEAKEKVTEMCRRAGWSESLCQQWWEGTKRSWTTRVPSRKRQRRTTDGNIGSAGVAGQGTKTESTSNSEKSVAASSGSEVTAPQRQSYPSRTTTITSSILVGSGSKGLDEQKNGEVTKTAKPIPSAEQGTPSAGTYGYTSTSYLSCTSIPASINGTAPPSCMSVSTYSSISEYKQGDNESAKVSKLTPIPFYQKTTFWLMGLITYTSEVPFVTGILV